MKKFVCVLFFSALLFQHSEAQKDTTLGPHQGKIQWYNNYMIEILGCNDYLEIYLYDKKRNPINNDYGVEGDVKFFFPNEVYSNSPFVHYGADAFTAKIPSPDYMYCRVTASINGIMITAKLENECHISVGR